jgi:cell division protein FtsB
MPASRPRTTRLLGGRDDAGGGREERPERPGGSTAVGAPTPARTFSGRLLVLTLVVVLIVFLAAPTTKIYLEQRAEIAALESAIADMEEQQASLEDRVDQWSDETYVKQQARDRLLYVMPGERSYLVVGADEMAGEMVDSSAAQIEAEKPAWVDALWQSVVASAYEDAAPADDTGGTGDTGGAGGTEDTDGAGSAGEAGPAAPGAAGPAEDAGAPPAGSTDESAGGTNERGTDPAAPNDEPQDAATDSGGTAAEEGTP